MSRRKKERAAVYQAARAAWQFHLSRRLTGDLQKYEPNWVHPIYQMAKDYLDYPERFQGDDLEDAANTLLAVADHRIVTQEWLGMGRLIHEGWKVGTPTWAFMGRGTGHLSFAPGNADLVVCCRVIPPELRGYFPDTGGCWEVWIAYSKSEPLGATALTANCYGPCECKDELLAVIRDDQASE